MSDDTERTFIDEVAPEASEEDIDTGDFEPGDGTETDDVPEADEADEAEEPAQQQRMVPQAALHETREELRQARERMAKMEGMWEAMQQQQRQQQPPAGQPAIEIPDYNTDPEGHYQARIAQLEQMVYGLGTSAQQQREQQAQQEQYQAALSQYRNEAAAFSREEPEFNNAYRWLIAQFDHSFKSMGMDPEERAHRLQMEEFALVGRARQRGENPAQALYQIAMNMGYAPQARDPDTGQYVARDAVQTAERGQQQAGRTLSNSRGSAERPVTMQRMLELADSDPEAFDKEWAKLAKRGGLG